jgi:AraC-like DNA-binding protein
MPLPAGTLFRVYLVGVFALFASRQEEASGTLGASLQLGDERDTHFRIELLNGRHYSDASDLTPLSRVNGDGTSVETLGAVELPGGRYRVDQVVVDVVTEGRPTVLRLKDLGSPASFVIFDVLLETEELAGCPFHSGSGGVALGEISAIVRVGDRVRFLRAVEQLEASLETAADLDEARGQALTFLAMVTAATLEMGGSREMHRVQLEAAREMDRLHDAASIAACARRHVEAIAGGLFKPAASPSSYLVDRALALVERNFARDLTDAAVAAQLGLSTSHFRYLFREATGQPFHKYLVALRLEKARQMLLAEEAPVSAVAKAVGFAGLSHFSRAFTQRFSVSPTSIRRQGS